MEHTICKMKTLLYGVNDILESADENISELIDTAIKLFKMKYLTARDGKYKYKKRKG